MLKKLLLSCFAPFSLYLTSFASGNNITNEPDSVYLFSYATGKNNNHNGLHFAWSRDRVHWFLIGNEYAYVKSDYGRWGSEKRMITPFLVQGTGDTWHCIWSLNEREHLFAYAASKDLVDWGRQSYPEVQAGSNVLRPVLQYDAKAGQYNITYTDAAGKYYRVTTKDFKSYSAATQVLQSEYINPSLTIALPGGSVTGQVHRVPWTVVDKLTKTYEVKQYRNNLYGESVKDDATRFAGLKPVSATISVQGSKAKPISDMLLGIFFEDINYAADGGLYAELVQNRDFEYALSDKEGRDKNWNATHSWTVKGEHASFTIDSSAPIHANNAHYAVLQTNTPGASLVNSGFDGIAVKKGEKYNFSLFTKQLEGKSGKLLVRLVSKNGEVLAQAHVLTSNNSWKTSKAVLVPSADAADATLELQPVGAGRLALDMISLFPQNTYKGRKNGMRADLAQVVADIHPRFVRFPGGCVAHGDGIHNIYRWKNTIGPLEARKPQRNLWGYHQTGGLGYFEYFQFCEDIGAQPLPVIAAGVPCQNSGSGPHGGGQQGGIPMEEMDEYIQEIFDLVEWANGDVNTKWGKLRAAAGHPKPFNLKYIGIGNEDMITDVFEERFTMIYNAMKEKHPEITVIGTVGPFYEGTDYEEGWELATKLKVPMVDEHYYNSPGWFIYNQDYYDKYDRSKSKVYLGEYASWGSTLYNALAEALYLTSLERNGDVVSMTSYAPLLAREGHTQWNPDMIYFNNTEVKPTVCYEVQRLYGHHSGNEYMPGSIDVSNNNEAVKKRIAYSVVRDTKSNDVIVKMVNLLPVAVNASLNLKDIALADSKGVKTVLQGNPADKNLKPVTSDCSVSENFTSELPPYSFTVIRLKTK
jgi:alpha-L-arabinofuranosidase